MNSVANQRPLVGPDVTPATARTTRVSPVPLTCFDEYVVVARLGHGGMAEVILGLSKGLRGFRKLVAIKRLHVHCEEDSELVQMFLHEASLAALLQHPNVVQTNKVGCADGRHFIAMEYLEGQAAHRVLQRVLAARGSLEPIVAARIAADALNGLHHAHEACDYDGVPLGIVHRDVSPQNVFVTFDGQVKVLDFGIAKASSSGVQTRPGLIKGKLSYIAPEQARGHALDRRADVWSVGVILWESLTGRRLFRGDDEVALVRAVLGAEIPMADSIRPEVPSALASIADRALRRIRDERYASAYEMKIDLETWLAASAEEDPRAALVRTMQTHFADTMRERREVVRACLDAVDSQERWQAFAPPESPILGGIQQTPPLATARPWHKGSKIGTAIAGAVLASAAAFAITQVRDMQTGLGAQPSGTPLPAQAPSAVLAARAGVAATVPAQTLPPASATPAPSAALAAAPLTPKPAQEPTSSDVKARHHSHLRERPAASDERADVVPPGAAPEHKPAVLPEAATQTSARGRLRLEASPYAIVSLEGKKLGITPIDVELPASVHILTLRNPEQGIQTTYRVQVVEGESIYRRIELE